MKKLLETGGSSVDDTGPAAEQLTRRVDGRRRLPGVGREVGVGRVVGSNELLGVLDGAVGTELD